MSGPGRLGPPPPRSDVRRNIDQPATPDEATRYLNCRVPNSVFKDIKRAALDEDMTLGDYLVHVHQTYQRDRR